ncbi:hypothetical protein FB451DRAFT_1370486 [Mycena latifolia]|nr:hypothetical protein FB451DRAFT_1370486 [Mycena latifolia]
MTLTSLVNLYRFVCVLCLSELVSSVWTIRNFGLASTGESQLFFVMAAAFTLPLAYRLAELSRRPEHPLAHVYKHIRALLFLMLISILGVAAGVAFLVGRGTDTVLAPCFAEWFLSARCAPVTLDMALPVAVLATLFCAIVRITRRAHAIHGEGMVPRPVTPTFVPAWELGNVAEMERADEETKGALAL